MNGSDFYSRMAPWTTCREGESTLVSGGGTPLVIVPPAPAGMNRWILSYAIANLSAAQVHRVRLVTTGGVVLASLGAWFPAVPIIVNRQIQNSGDTELNLEDMTAGLNLTFAWCVILADTPPNVLSNLVVGQYAG